MKKVLLAGSAIVAAGMLTAGAAKAADPIKLSVGGYSKWWVVGQWNDDKYQANNGRANYNNVDVKGDNEIFFGGSTTLDNGLKVGVSVELEAGGHTDKTDDAIDKSFAYVEGGFGKVILGSEANGTVLLHVMAPDAAANNAGDGLLTGGFAIVKPANVNVKTTTEIDTDDNAEKITYVAPSFGGLTLGASYIPNATEDNRSTGVAQQIYGVGAGYARAFGPVDVKLSAGWVTYDIAATTSRSQEWSTGGQLSYAGFTVGGSYRKVSDNFKGGTNSTSTSGARIAADTVSNSGRTWDAGIQYATGPFAVSLLYFNSKTAGLAAVSGDDEATVYQVSGKYALGPGVDLLGTIGHAEFDDETAKAAGGDTNHNKGWAVMTGLSLAF